MLTVTFADFKSALWNHIPAAGYVLVPLAIARMVNLVCRKIFHVEESRSKKSYLIRGLSLASGLATGYALLGRLHFIALTGRKAFGLCCLQCVLPILLAPGAIIGWIPLTSKFFCILTGALNGASL